MPDVVLFGGGGHARVLLDVLGRLGRTVLGYAAPTPFGARAPLRHRGRELPWLGDDASVGEAVDRTAVDAVFALGKVDVGARRWRVFEELSAAGWRFPPVVAPSATVHADVELGDGTVVLDGAVVATGARLGRACVVNTRASVDHDAHLGDDVHVAPGATLCGDVAVGAGCLIGAGATLVPGVRVAPGALVGAGATVVADLAQPGTYLGTPARRRV